MKYLVIQQLFVSKQIDNNTIITPYQVIRIVIANTEMEAINIFLEKTDKEYPFVNQRNYPDAIIISNIGVIK